MSLYEMWLNVHKNGTLPAEWQLAHNFLTWATANGYKTEYGYEGEFTPESLLAAKQAGKPLKEVASKYAKKCVTGFENAIKFGTSDPVKENEQPMDAETLKNSMNKEAIIALAKEKGVKISGTETKRQIADLIVAKEDADES